MAREISKYEDVIDSRDVIARIAELTDLRDDADYGLDEDEAHELAALETLAAEASGYAADWEYGEALIRDSYFREYAQELAEETGDIDFSKLSWPLTCIDWEQAARELQMDYTSVTFDGVDYWIR